MHLDTKFDQSEMADEWAIRSDNWLVEASEMVPPRKRRERNSTPLIITGQGASLRVENGALIVRDGFTHYPQKQVTHCFFPGSRDMPQRILLLDGSGSLSFDALSWLGEQGVALVRVKWSGEVAIVASCTGYAVDPAKVEWQREINADHERRLAYVADLIRRKLVASLDVLTGHIPQTQKCAVAIEYHHKAIERLDQHDFSEISDLRGIEGHCASVYFRAWQGLPVAWTGRRAVPDEWRAYDIRSSMANGIKPINRHASHPVNAILNYAYAVKQAQLQMQAIADGYDPTIGILHHGRRGKPAYIFDMIEPERPKVDATILAFIANRSFSAADFVLRKDGVCRLSPQLARVVARLAV